MHCGAKCCSAGPGPDFSIWIPDQHGSINMLQRIRDDETPRVKPEGLLFLEAF